MLKQPNLTDDLFEKSSMSFGEHLDELRKALVKSAIWLAAGTLIGLFFATSVVKFIEQPLRAAMDEFYLNQTAARFKKINNVEAPEPLLDWMKDHSVMPELVFLDPAQLKALTDIPAGAALASSAASGNPIVQPSEEAKADPSETKVDAKSLSSADAHKAVWKDLSASSIERLQPLLMMRPIPNRLLTFDALEGFLIWLKAGLLVGAIVASPGIFFHIWEFLAAGLYPHERRYVYLYLPMSVLLFVAGVSLAFFVIFKLVISFLLTYNVDMDIDFAPRLKDYISFALFLPLGFGVAFQLPIVMLGLNRFGIIPLELYVSKWRIAVLGIAFLSMVLTPADAYSMIGMFIPLTLLYFLGIGLCKFMPKGPGVGSQAFDPA